MPALGPVPAPELTLAGSRLVPIFPLHVAPWLVSASVARAHGIGAAHPLTHALHSWEMPSLPPSGAHVLAKGPQ